MFLFLMISILLNVLKCALWPCIGVFLVNIPWELEQIVYSSILGWNVLYMSIRSNWLMILFSSTKSLWIFCLPYVSVTEKRGRKSPNSLVNLSVIFFLEDLSFCLPYFDSVFRCIHSKDWSVSLRTDPFLYPCNLPYYEVYFVWN